MTTTATAIAAIFKMSLFSLPANIEKVFSKLNKPFIKNKELFY